MIIDDLSQISDKNFFTIIIGSGPAGSNFGIRIRKKKN